MKILKGLCVFLMLGSLAGCAGLWDAPKNIAGVSIRNMENRRPESIYQSYECSMNDCFNAIVEIASINKYNIFQKDEARGVIVLMDVPGAVDTTEVGVFLTMLEKRQGVKVEVSSRSSPAKRTAAVLFFAELAKKFTKI